MLPPMTTAPREDFAGWEGMRRVSGLRAPAATRFVSSRAGARHGLASPEVGDQRVARLGGEALSSGSAGPAVTGTRIGRPRIGRRGGRQHTPCQIARTLEYTVFGVREEHCRCLVA